MNRLSLPDWLANATFGKVRAGLSGGDYKSFSDPDNVAESSLNDAHVVTAKIKGRETYRLLLDLDSKHYYIPSSTEGHGHLIINVELSRSEHDEVLEMLSSLGIVEHGYSKASKIRKLGASLRLPWVVKGEDKTWNEQHPL